MGRGRGTVEFLVGLNKYRDVLFRMLGLPLLGSGLKRAFDAKGAIFVHIPVYEGLEPEGGAPLPIAIAESFIRQACHHVILDFCPCRRAMSCEEYDERIGCIFLGRGAREISPEVGRHVNVEEALNNLYVAVRAGLVPVVSKVKFDADYLGVKEHRRLMTICLCCPCCCLAGGVRHAPRDVRDLIVRLEGLEVKTTGDCKGCGVCVEACIFKQIDIIDGQAVIGEECKGCGRCAAVCPNRAITVRVGDPTYVRRCIERVSSFVDVS